MAKFFALSGIPDQMPHSVVSDPGLHCLPVFMAWPIYIKKYLLEELGPEYTPFNPKQTRGAFPSLNLNGSIIVKKYVRI